MANKPQVKESLKSRLIMTIVFIATLIFIVVAMAFSWFVNNETVTANGMKVNVKAPDTFNVSLLKSDGLPADENFSLSGMVPDGIKVFYIKIENQSDSKETVDVLFSKTDNGSDDSDAETTQSAVNLLDVITLRTNFSSEEDEDISLSSFPVEVATGIDIPANDSVQIECTFKMSSEAGNEYQNLDAVIDEIVVK